MANHIFERVAPLTEEQRAQAQGYARMRVAGDEPQAAQFDNRTQSRLPRGMRYLIYALALAMLFFAFLPSAMRIHAVALDTFGQTITHDQSRYLAALSIVMMAEIGLIIFSLARATVDAGHAWQKRAYDAGALISACIALAGNAVAVGAHALRDAFTFLETFAPPVLTLILAQVLKAQMLEAVAHRHAAHTAYTHAHKEWQRKYTHAESEPAWMRVYANALRDAFRDANRRRSAVMREVNNDEWRLLINRELQADAWYIEAEKRAETARIAVEETRMIEAQARMRVIESRNTHAVSSGNRTGEAQNAVYEAGDGWRVHACGCGKTFERAYDEQTGAMNAYSAHLRSASHQTWADTQADGASTHAPVSVYTNGNGKGATHGTGH